MLSTEGSAPRSFPRPVNCPAKEMQSRCVHLVQLMRLGGLSAQIPISNYGRARRLSFGIFKRSTHVESHRSHLHSQPYTSNLV